MDIRHCFVPNLPGIIKTEKKEKKELDTEMKIENDIKNEKNAPKKTENSEIKAMKKEEKRVIAKELEKEFEKGEEEVEKKVVIMAKHLCGVATDLALRSLESFKIRNSDQIGNFQCDLVIFLSSFIFFPCICFVLFLFLLLFFVVCFLLIFCYCNDNVFHDMYGKCVRTLLSNISHVRNTYITLNKV